MSKVCNRINNEQIVLVLGQKGNSHGSKGCLLSLCCVLQKGLVVQRLDNAIQRINQYPVDTYWLTEDSLESGLSQIEELD